MANPHSSRYRRRSKFDLFKISARAENQNKNIYKINLNQLAREERTTTWMKMMLMRNVNLFAPNLFQ